MSSPSLASSLNPLLTSNPLTDFPPFDKIKDEHFAPTFEHAMNEHISEINSIVITQSSTASSSMTSDGLLAALERSGQRLNWVKEIFYNLNSCCITPERQKLEVEMLPKLQAHRDSTFLMNEKLFEKVKKVYLLENQHEQQNNDHVDDDHDKHETRVLLKRYFDEFVRAGANLKTKEDRELLHKLNAELASLEAKFQQNVLAEVSLSSVWFDSEEELSGFSASELDEFQKEAQQEHEASESKGGETVEETPNTNSHHRRFLVKIRNTTCQPQLLKNLHVRSSRKKIFESSVARGTRGNQFDNRKIVTDIMTKRSQKATLLGFENYASLMLSKEMAGDTRTVDEFLQKLVTPAMNNLDHEFEVLSKFAKERDGVEDFASYDWDYYRNQLILESEQQKQKQEETANDSTNIANLDEYFELNQVLHHGLFYAASRLYNMSFEEELDEVKFPKYHSSLRIFSAFYHHHHHRATSSTVENNNKNNQETQKEFLGHIIFDFFERPKTKYQGACIYLYRHQSNRDDIGKRRPIIGFYTNFKVKSSSASEQSSSSSSSPLCLLTQHDVITLFHEFGHTLQALHSQVQYPTLSCTVNLANDYVEFPSKVNEHFAHVPEILSNYAKHYKTGEPLPKVVFDRLSIPRNHQATRQREQQQKETRGQLTSSSGCLKTTANVAYETVEFLASVALDQAWHRMSSSEIESLTEQQDLPSSSSSSFFTQKALESFGVFHPVCPPRYLITFFSHIICWAYPATYYGYLFSEVLDADATEWFYENGETNNPANGETMRKIILSTGATEDPKVLLRKFFGGREPRVEPMLMRRGLL